MSNSTVEKKIVTPEYIEIEPDMHWEVHCEGAKMGEIIHLTYCFPFCLFSKGAYYFIPTYEEDKTTTGKTKEKAFKKFLDIYCEAVLKE